MMASYCLAGGGVLTAVTPNKEFRPVNQSSEHDPIGENELQVLEPELPARRHAATAHTAWPTSW